MLCIRTIAGRERSVSRRIARVVAKSGATAEIIRRWPGYLILKNGISQETVEEILKQDGVFAITPFEEELAAEVQRETPKILPGHPVKILSGAMQDCKAIVLETNAVTGLAEIRVHILGAERVCRNVPLEDLLPL